jgi:hypothetical protein
LPSHGRHFGLFRRTIRSDPEAVLPARAAVSVWGSKSHLLYVHLNNTEHKTRGNTFDSSRRLIRMTSPVHTVSCELFAGSQPDESSAVCAERKKEENKQDKRK